jgi:hypothetical protein
MSRRVGDLYVYFELASQSDANRDRNACAWAIIRGIGGRSHTDDHAPPPNTGRGRSSAGSADNRTRTAANAHPGARQRLASRRPLGLAAGEYATS